MKRYVINVFLAVGFLGGVYLFLLLYPPTLLFAHEVQYQAFTIHSDRPIDDNIQNIIDDVTVRISKSELYDENIKFNLFISNDLWKFNLFSMNQPQAGAVTYGALNGNVFFRPCDIAKNEIVPPPSWKFSRTDRPLSYFIAHEATHVLEANYSKKSYLSSPTWLIEGYADYIGKGGDFDFDENVMLYKANAPELDPQQGLYRRYHLAVAHLMDTQHLSFRELATDTPDEQQILTEIIR